MTDRDYADDLAVLTSTPTQAKSLLHSLERRAKSIGLYVMQIKHLFKQVTIFVLSS